MQFTKRSIGKFKHLYFQNFGEDLSDEDARVKAGRLIELYRVAYGMPSFEEFFAKKTHEDEKK